MYKNNDFVLQELEKFNQDHERDNNKFKLLVDTLPTNDYAYTGKTISEIRIKAKKIKVKVYKKDIDTDTKLF
jgi:hypothetical protein